MATYGVSIEIEEAVRAQAALRESERYLQHMIDTMPVGIVLSDNSGTPFYVTKRLVDNNGLNVSRESEGSRLNIIAAVEDLGRGLTAPERVFEAFYTTKSDALGIGLAICRSISKAHGGQLSADNRVSREAS